MRVPRVYIYNTRNDAGTYNNSKGEFTIPVAKGDTLIAAVQGYRVDTLTYQSQNSVIFYLRRLSIQLQDVLVTDSSKTPEQRLAESQKEYHDIYRKGSTKDLLQVGGGNGLGGAGLGIDALWNLLSREGKNARFLQKVIERDYREMIISYRYNRNTVASVTGLTGASLTDFMQQYRPSYYFVLDANDYYLAEFIKNSYRQYQKDPSLRRLPPLTLPRQ
jgi:hypothetical protein